MKFLVAFVAIAMFVSVQALTEAQKEAVKEKSRACIKETGVDTANIQKIRAGDFDFDDEKMKIYTFCMLRKTGLMSEDGTFLRDVAVSKVEEENKEKVGKAIDTCLAKETGATKEEKAWNYVKCYHIERPDHAVI